MEVIFLGTGTSEGVPLIEHESTGLDLRESKNWRTRSSIHVEMDGYHIQVDAAQEFRLQCLQQKVRRVDAFILTHGHADHILGMDDLRQFCRLQGGKALPVYSTEAGLDRVKNIFPYAIREQSQASYPAFDLRRMPYRLATPGGVVQATLLEHGDIEVLGLVFEEQSSRQRFTYYCDCKRVSKEQRDLARGSAAVVLDGLRPYEHPTHMSIPEAIVVAEAIAAPLTFLTHTTSRVDYNVWERKLPESIHLAYDGLRLLINEQGVQGFSGNDLTTEPIGDGSAESAFRLFR